ncbi:kinase-like domain-containing protein [Mycena floridula]|nr:kinase-like domain-containing protein [Mycena floridula]
MSTTNDFRNKIATLITALNHQSWKQALSELDDNYDKLSPAQKKVVNDRTWGAFGASGVYPQLEVTSHVEFDNPRRVIGKGSYGQVFVARCRGQEVAVKMLGGDLNEDWVREVLSVPKRHLDFFRELRAWQGIGRHRNILALVGYYFTTGVEIGLVSPLGDTDLYSWAKRAPPSEDRQRYAFASPSFLILDIAQGLHHLQQTKPNPIVHGDLRAPNIILFPEEDHLVAKIGDFGIAKFGDKESSFTLNSVERPLLWPHWLAYELLRNRRAPRTKASDLFAFGRIVIEIFTGRPPFLDVLDSSNPQHRVSDSDLVPYILAPNIPSRPARLHSNVWKVMKMYWSVDPAARGSPQDMIACLQALAK